jgi:hypothetical protein
MTTTQKSSPFNAVTSWVTGNVKSVQSIVTSSRPARPGLAERFQAWLAGAAPTERKALYTQLAAQEEAFAAWLQNLPDKERRAFVEEIGAFCTNLKFELSWLLEPQLGHDPELKQRLEGAVLSYCLARWQGHQAQENIKVYATFKAWQAAPHKKEHQALTQQLFFRLVEKKLISEPPSELFLAPERERQFYVVQAIRQAAEKDHSTFQGILKEIVAADAAASSSFSPAALLTAAQEKIVETTTAIISSGPDEEVQDPAKEEGFIY